MVVYKYKLPETACSHILQLPKNSKILHVHPQGPENFLWVQVPDPNAEKEDREITIVGTGWEFEGEKRRYIGTLHLPPFVWHVYEDVQ